MKTYYGNYLGVVITGGEKDPEGRGRCQVFVPNVMPALYDNWNELGENIEFEVIGQGLEGQLTKPVVDRLRQILPWAECAAPITGASPSYKPSFLDRASETIRNVGRVVVDTAKEVLGINPAIQGDAATNLALSNVIADEKTAALSCGRTARDVTMTKLFGYTEAEVRAANGGQRQDGKNWDVILENLGWEKVKVNSPGEAPSNSMLVYKSDPDLGKGARNGGGGTYGHIEYKGVDANGNPSYYYGRGMKPNPGGSVPDNFTGFAYIPPPDAQARALKNAGLPSVSPSALSHPSPTTSMPQDPTQETALNADLNQQISSGQDFSSLEASAPPTAQQSFSSIDGTGLSPNEIKYMMRIAASESGAGISGGSYVRNELNDPLKRVGYANGFSSGSQADLRASGQQVISGGRFTSGAYRGKPFSWDKVDIGFLQTNPSDTSRFGFVNSGSYKDQIVGSAGGLRNYLKNRKDGAAIQAAIERGDFATADAALDNYWFGLGRAGGQKDMAKLEGVIASKYGGDVNAALEGLNGEYGSTASIEEMSNGQFTPEPSTPSSFDTANQPSTHTPTPHQGISGPNTNNQALGMFGYASEGQAVWVFFREGDPLSPVYFAASYGQKEWKNMYRYSSPGMGAGEGGALPGTEAMALNTYGGGFRSAMSTEDSPLGPNFSFQLYDKNGSNLSFLKDHTEFNSMYNHVDRVMGDHHDITEANKEVRVRGDYNRYVEQDVFITVGNWSDEALAASDEIQQYINEAMEIKSAAGDTGGGGGSSSEEQGPQSTQEASSTTSQAPAAEATTTPQESKSAFYQPTELEVTQYTKALNDKKRTLSLAEDFKNSSDPQLKAVYDSAKRGYEAQKAVNQSKGIPDTR